MGRHIAVLGSGSWGTAFSLVLADAGNDVVMWARREELAKAIRETHENPGYLPGLPLPERITATHDVAAALKGADIVVLATPSQTLRENLREWAPLVEGDAIFVSLMKGVELGTLNRMSEVIAQETGVDASRIAVVSGPNLAKEIARREPAASVVACADEAVASALQDRMHTPAFRPYTSTDVIGCEIGGAYKNVVALAVGMAVGLGMGDNSTASVITRGLAETARLGMTLGANPLTLMGLAGLGDLVATCSSPLSRNRTFGERLGHGETTADIVATTNQVAEGAKSCSSLRALCKKKGVDAPLAAAVDDADGRRAPVAFDQGRTRLTRRRQAVAALIAWLRSFQRSSTSSIPTDRRSSPSGTSGDSLTHRRRRSRVDSTPPSEVACVQRRTRRSTHSAASAVGRTMASIAPKPGSRTSTPAAASREASSRALAEARSIRSASVRRPRRASHASNGPGMAPSRSRRPLRTFQSSSSVTTSAPMVMSE
jgi:glycerol-3-phosphate dehydrogenase (NAD(P)+)